VAGFPTILSNHRLTLDSERGIHPEVRVCSLAKNPVHLDMVECARLARPDFCLNTVFDSHDRMLMAVAGDPEAAHREGCQRAEQALRLSVSEPVDVLITSAGGLPYDANFMQSLKAVFNMQEIVRPGGAILWIAECAGGIHPGFLNCTKFQSDDKLEDAVRANYALTGHNSLMLRRLTRKASVGLWSTLPADVVAQLGMQPISSLPEGLAWIQKRFRAAFTFAVVPHANVVCASVG